MLTEYLRILTTIDMVDRRIPVISFQGNEEGPKVWLVANCHGDEVTGIEVIHRIWNELSKSGLEKGTIYAIPLMNPMGNELIQRRVPFDKDDLNRNYPGKEDGEPTERLAHLIYTKILGTAPDLVIDLHTSTIRALPYIILDRFTDEDGHPDPDLSEKLAEMAHIFGITVIYDFVIDEYKKRHLDRSLPGALLNKAHILAYTVELGPTRIVSDPFVEVGVQGICNILRFLGMIKPAETPWIHTSYVREPKALRRDRDVRANCTGLIQYLVEPGEKVQAGQIVAHIKNILGEVLEMIKVKHSSYIIELADRGVAFPGTPIMILAVLDEM